MLFDLLSDLRSCSASQRLQTSTWKLERHPSGTCHGNCCLSIFVPLAKFSIEGLFLFFLFMISNLHLLECATWSGVDEVGLCNCQLCETDKEDGVPV